MAEKLLKEKMAVELTKADAEEEEAAAVEALKTAEEEEADVDLELAEIDVEIAETEDEIDKTENALEKAEHQEKLDDAVEIRVEIVVRQTELHDTTELMKQRAEEAEKNAEAARKLAD